MKLDILLHLADVVIDCMHVAVIRASVLVRMAFGRGRDLTIAATQESLCESIATPQHGNLC